MPRSASATLQTVIASPDLVCIDLWQIELPQGVQRWTSSPSDLNIGGTAWSATAPAIKHGPVRMTSGVEVSTLDVELGGQFLIGGIPIAALAATGSFDDAKLIYMRVYLPDAVTAPTLDHELTLFIGYVYEVRPESSKVKLSAKSLLAKGQDELPRRLAGPMCAWIWGGADGRCGITRATYTSTDTVAGGSTTQAIVLVTGTSTNIRVGSLITFADGQQRWIVAWNAGTKTATLDSPLPAIPSGTVSIMKGCLKTKADCDTTYTNLVRFGAFPAMPSKN